MKNDILKCDDCGAWLEYNGTKVVCPNGCDQMKKTQDEIPVKHKWEKQDSIKVSRTSTGKYAFEIKLYFNASEEHHKEVVKEIKQIETKLKNDFKLEIGEKK